MNLRTQSMIAVAAVHIAFLVAWCLMLARVAGSWPVAMDAMRRCAADWRFQLIGILWIGCLVALSLLWKRNAPTRA